MEFRARRDKQGATKEAEITTVEMNSTPLKKSASLRNSGSCQVTVLRAFRGASCARSNRESLLLEVDLNSALQVYESLWGSPRCSPSKEKIVML